MTAVFTVNDKPCVWSRAQFQNSSTLPSEVLDDGFVPEVEWSDFAWSNLLIPLLMQVVLMPVLKLFRWIFTKNMQFLGLFIYAFIGTEAQPKVKYPQFMVGCYVLQFVLSFTYVIISGERMKPPHETSEAVRVIEVVLLIFFIFHYWVIQIRNEFSLKKAWGAAPLIDVFTIVPAFRPDLFPDQGQAPRWLTFDFLRIYHVLVAFERVSAVLDRHISEFTRAVIIRALRVVALGVMYGGTVLVLEVLGEIPMESLQDKPISTAMGDISMVQMVYWICTTIAMVGYGDYSPTTALTKITTALCILSGVTFFTWVCNSLVKLKTLLGRGEGSYAMGKDRKHVVVVGVTVGRGGLMVQTFLEEIFHPEHENEGWPDVVILSETPIQQQLRDFVRGSRALSTKVRDKVILLVGKAADAEDLKRVQIDACQLALVLPDLESLFPEAEDEGNIQRALSMKCYGGNNMPLRLLLCCGKSRAVNAGVPATCCLSVMDLKANILAHSMRVPGFIPLLSNLMRSFQTPSRELGSLSQDMKDFFHGVGYEIYGLTLRDDMAGQSFGNIASGAFESHGILLLAVLVKGQLLMAPMKHICRAGSVILCMAQDARDAQKFSQRGTDWRTVLHKQQEDLSREELNSPGHVQSNTGGPPNAHPHAACSSLEEILRSQSPGAHLQETLNSPALDSQESREHAVHVPRLTAEGSAGTEAFEPEQEPGEQERLAHGAFGDSSFPGVSESNHNAEDPHSNAAAASWEQNRLLARRYRRHPACITVIVLGKVPWQQLATFIGLLRAEILPFVQPLLVLCEESPPEWMNGMFKAVGFIVGLPRMDNLLRVGLLTSCKVALLAGEVNPEKNAHEADSRMLMVASMLEHLSVAFGRGAIFRLYEFQHGKSVSLLPDNLFRPGDDKQYHGGQPVKQKPKVTELKMHPRYIAGEIMTSDFIGTMLGRMYYLPGTVELVEAYAMYDATGTQDSFSWQTQVPPDFVHKTFLELFKHYGCRNESNNEGSPALAIALYRQASDGDNFYVLTCPPKSMVLKKADYVIWLGSVQFGKEMTRNQLLRDASLQASAPMISLDQGGLNGAAQSSNSSPGQAAHAPAKLDDVSNLHTSEEDRRLQALEQLLTDMNQKLERLSNEHPVQSAGGTEGGLGEDRSSPANVTSQERQPSRQGQKGTKDHLGAFRPPGEQGNSQSIGRMEPAMCLKHLVPCAQAPEKHAAMEVANGMVGSQQNQPMATPYLNFSCNSVCREPCATGKETISTT